MTDVAETEMDDAELDRRLRIIAPLVNFSFALSDLGFTAASNAMDDAMEPLLDHLGLIADDITTAIERYPAEPFYMRTAISNTP
jgi:hypothetical protein